MKLKLCQEFSFLEYFEYIFQIRKRPGPKSYLHLPKMADFVNLATKLNVCRDSEILSRIACSSGWKITFPGFCRIAGGLTPLVDIMKPWKARSQLQTSQSNRSWTGSGLRKDPKIKKRESGLWPYSVDPPPNLNYGLFTQNLFAQFFWM